MPIKPDLRLISEDGTPQGHPYPLSMDDHPARFFRYKDASNFYDLTTNPKDGDNG
jgi:hypothetical protein